MKRLIAAVVLVGTLLGWAGVTYLIPPAHSAGNSDLGRIVTSVGSVTYSGFQSLTPNSTTASSLTASPTTAEKAFITLETASVRFRLDGTSPTTTEGHLLTSGQNLTLNTPSQISNFRVISVSTHGVLKISYGK